MTPEKVIASTIDPVAFEFPWFEERRKQAMAKAKAVAENLEARGFPIDRTNESEEE